MQGSASSIHRDVQIGVFLKPFNLTTSFGWLFLAIFMNVSCYFPALFFLIVVFLILEPLGVDFELPRGLPPLKHLHFTMKNLHFWYNEVLHLKMLLRLFSGASWARFGTFWGWLGALLVPKRVRAGTPNFQNFLFGHPWAPILAPEDLSTAPNSSPGALMARQRAPRNHQIPSGHVFRRIFLRFGGEIKEKRK